MSQSPHIVIVDDEAPAREMVGDYLKMHGFTVTLCDGGKSLRGAIDTSVPDLVWDPLESTCRHASLSIL